MLKIEECVHWVIRATGIAEQRAKLHKVSDWVTNQREIKWSWAGHVARRWDGRWSAAVLNWTPAGIRKVGRPRIRWDQRICDFVETYVELDPESWMALAQDREAWKALKEDFAQLEG